MNKICKEEHKLWTWKKDRCIQSSLGGILVLVEEMMEGQGREGLIIEQRDRWTETWFTPIYVQLWGPWKEGQGRGGSDHGEGREDQCVDNSGGLRDEEGEINNIPWQIRSGRISNEPFRIRWKVSKQEVKLLGVLRKKKV